MSPSKYEALVQRVISDMYRILLNPKKTERHEFLDKIHKEESEQYIKIWDRNFCDVVREVANIKDGSSK